jgi:hypothetical protein
MPWRSFERGGGDDAAGAFEKTAAVLPHVVGIHFSLLVDDGLPKTPGTACPAVAPATVEAEFDEQMKNLGHADYHTGVLKTPAVIAHVGCVPRTTTKNGACNAPYTKRSLE